MICRVPHAFYLSIQPHYVCASTHFSARTFMKTVTALCLEHSRQSPTIKPTPFLDLPCNPNPTTASPKQKSTISSHRIYKMMFIVPFLVVLTSLAAAVAVPQGGCSKPGNTECYHCNNVANSIALCNCQANTPEELHECRKPLVSYPTSCSVFNLTVYSTSANRESVDILKPFKQHVLNTNEYISY